jgi:hypothetical protein
LGMMNTRKGVENIGVRFRKGLTEEVVYTRAF